MMETPEKTGTLVEFLGVGLASPLGAGDAGEGLKTLQIVPEGLHQTVHGPVLLTREAALALVRAFEQAGEDLLVDYEHHSEMGAHAAPDGTVRAAGWIKALSFEPARGLCASVQWNARAREMIRSGEYRSCSPVLILRKRDGLVMGLKSVAVTNQPALKGLERLAASRRGAQQTPRIRKLSMENMLELVNERGAGLPADAPDAEIRQAAMKLIETIPVSEPDLDDATRVALKERDEARAALKARELDEQVQVWVGQGKLTKSMEQAARVLVCKAQTEFAAFVESMPVIVPQGRLSQPPAGGAQVGSRAQVIVKALRTFKSEATLSKLTDAQAYVNLALRDAGLPVADADELKRFV